MSYEDIKQHLQECMVLKVSVGTINAVTDKLIPIVAEWQNRPLKFVYTIVFLNAMHFKMRDEGRVSHKVIYNILGIENTLPLITIFGNV